ncbi:MAG: transcription-repair coupling factor [bacterium]|nr:transcription-repair coupling factor [bacterium]
MEKKQQFFDFNKVGGEFERLHLACENNKKVSVLGLNSASLIAFCAFFKRPVLFLTSDYISATQIKERFETILGQVSLLPFASDRLFYKRSVSCEQEKEKLKVMCDIANGKMGVCVAPIDSLIDIALPKENLKKSQIKLKVNGETDLVGFKEKIAKLGYNQVEICSNIGEFSARGDIVDIFISDQDHPIRIEFFGDIIEKIYSLEENSKVKQKFDELVIYPNTNLLYSESEKREVLEFLYSRLEKAKKDDANQVFINSLTEVISRLEVNELSFSLDYVLSLFNHSNILDLLPKETLIVIDEGKTCYDTLVKFSNEFENRFLALKKTKANLCDESGYFNYQEVIDKINKFSTIVCQKITNANRFFEPDFVFNFKTIPVSRYYHDFSTLVTDIKNWQINGFDVFLFAGSSGQAESLNFRLNENDIFIDIKENAKLSDNKSAIIPSSLNGGFILGKEKKVVLSTTDLFVPKRKKEGVSASRKNAFSVPKAGDYVVHVQHGIGVCEGITNLSSNFGSKDFVVVRYRDGDKLYVPIDGLNQLERFSGAEKPARLSKIGGVEFSHVKEKVKSQVKKLAIDLIELYAKREAKPGYAFSKDDAMQREFEDSFPFIETTDQLKSIAEIKKDMEQGKVMDRLLCGDVGFGKTEVSLRAMFKAVLNNKQVAFVAPTTILSEQHYNTCVKRMESFGVRIAVLNRFRSAKETKQILADLKMGKIDIICGTHRLFSDDVVFADLGLVVLDEEQKFGVEDKEKLKNKYPNVDYLTLSATPIPRTLNMSLSGIRDISIINTPPIDRIPIQTSVCEYSDSLMRDAIVREISRGGQVFVLYNRVETIYKMAEKIRALVPEARVLVAHGKLKAKELEDTVYDFYQGNADVLVCSTIIENGIDVLNANTLIVIDSERFGLSQLYQIRGRVGRGNKLAYAYLTYDYDKVLSEEASKRLEAMSEFVEFGSGFKIAMRDLEIRGSGNVLGAEQHGFMQKVGFELYSKLLAEAVAEIRGEKVKEVTNTIMKIDIDAFIPENYITNPANRMTVYKNISAISSRDEMEELIKDIESSFGKLPKQSLNLVKIAYARFMASEIGATEVVSTPLGIKIVFDKASKITSSENIGEAVYQFRNYCAIDLGQTSFIKLDKTETKEGNLDRIINFLECATNSKN